MNEIPKTVIGSGQMHQIGGRQKFGNAKPNVGILQTRITATYVFVGFVVNSICLCRRCRLPVSGICNLLREKSQMLMRTHKIFHFPTVHQLSTTHIIFGNQLTPLHQIIQEIIILCVFFLYVIVYSNITIRNITIIVITHRRVSLDYEKVKRQIP